MVRIESGVFFMGSDTAYPEEGPSREVRVDGFSIDAGPVTNDRFSAFVEDTGYVTLAERKLDVAVIPGLDPDGAAAGSVCSSRQRSRSR